jgi:hypothetical protein
MADCVSCILVVSGLLTQQRAGQRMYCYDRDFAVSAYVWSQLFLVSRPPLLYICRTVPSFWGNCGDAKRYPSITKERVLQHSWSPSLERLDSIATLVPICHTGPGSRVSLKTLDDVRTLRPSQL